MYECVYMHMRRAEERDAGPLRKGRVASAYANDDLWWLRRCTEFFRPLRGAVTKACSSKDDRGGEAAKQEHENRMHVLAE